MVPVDEKLDMRQRCALAARKASCILSSIKRWVANRARKVIGPLCSTLVMITRPGAPNTEKMWSCWNSSRGGLLRWSLLEHLSYKDRLRELGFFSLRREDS